MNKKIISLYAGLLTLTGALFLSCENNYSVFSGGTGGLIVDAESTSTPKSGIASVDVYAYTDSSTRDSDYNSWREGTVFSPSNNYYGHTSTDDNGNFTISNIVWKAEKPEFGKDADYTTIYLLFYHENYGLTKDSTVITSDSTSNTVYAELKAIKKTTALTINVYDVSNSNLISDSVLVKVSVPQNTETLQNAKAKVYEQTITGSGTIYISYPRWKNVADKSDEKENEPEVSITYAQSTDTITWKACANGDNEANNFAFYSANEVVKKVIQNSSYTISLFGKACRIYLPTINGTYGDSTDAANDGIKIRMKAKDSEGNYTIDCGEVSTSARDLGNSGNQSHGNFSELGSGYFFTDNTYTEKNKMIDVKFYKIGNDNTETELSASNSSFLNDSSKSYNVSLQ